jgi:hypothetical protein
MIRPRDRAFEPLPIDPLHPILDRRIRLVRKPRRPGENPTLDIREYI